MISRVGAFWLAYCIAMVVLLVLFLRFVFAQEGGDIGTPELGIIQGEDSTGYIYGND